MLGFLKVFYAPQISPEHEKDVLNLVYLLGMWEICSLQSLRILPAWANSPKSILFSVVK